MPLHPNKEWIVAVVPGVTWHSLSMVSLGLLEGHTYLQLEWLLVALMGTPNSHTGDCDVQDSRSLLCSPAPLYNCVGVGLFHTGETGNNDVKSVLARLGFTASKTKTVFSGLLPLILEPVMQEKKLDTLE